MKRIQGLMLVLGFGLVLMGCDENFLTTVPPDEISDAVFWKTEEDAILATNAIYPLVYGDEVLYFDAASDNAWAQKAFDGWYPIGNGTVDASSGTTDDFWNDSYRAIRRANELLANIEKIEDIDPGLKERLKGEASFHRAYHYNMLVNLFGDVPLILEPISIAESDVSRTPRAQVVTQIMQDLDFAAGVLPVSYPASDAGRATKGAALALKARAALYAGQYDVAAQAAKAVMDLGVYSLHPDYAELFTYAGEGSAEIIFADQRLKDQRSQDAFSDHGPGTRGGSSVVPLRSLVDAYYMEDGLPITESPLYDPDNPYENRDPRFYASILYPGATFGDEVYNSLPDSPTADRLLNDFNATATGFNIRKYILPEDESDPGNSGVDFILIRYADVLLMYAEAKIELGQIDQSVYDAINAVRERAGLPEITQGKTQEELRQIVRHERRVELALEGLRLFDIRRWRTAELVMPGQKYGMTYTGEGGEEITVEADNRFFDPSRDYLWPIPIKELDLNPDLGQNPGY